MAKQAAQIDILSGERLRLGVGTGWNYVEYDSLNTSFDDRGARQAEQIRLLRQLWQEPVVDFTGDFHRVERAGLKPLPKRQIPVWFGGFTPVAFRRAAQIGDGFIFGSGHSQNLQALQTMRQALATAGRPAEEFGVEALLNYQSGRDAWRAEAEAWRNEGADFISMRAQALRGQGDGLSSPQAHIDALSTYWEEVGDLNE